MKKALSMVLVLTMVLSVAAGCSSPAAPPEEEAKPDETVGTTPKFRSHLCYNGGRNKPGPEKCTWYRYSTNISPCF